MSPLAFVFMLIAAIIILTVLTLKFKMHPVMVLFITATFCGIASGKSLVDTFSSITSYFWFHAGQHRRHDHLRRCHCRRHQRYRRRHQHGELLHPPFQRANALSWLRRSPASS